jgi:hypothetical protein
MRRESPDITADGSMGDQGDMGGGGRRPLWTVEPAVRPRMPDPVRAAAVRAVIIVAVTLVQAMIAFLCTLAGSWFAFPAVVGTVAGTVVATWSVLDVWVTRQVWNQRHGVRPVRLRGPGPPGAACHGRDTANPGQEAGAPPAPRAAEGRALTALVSDDTSEPVSDPASDTTSDAASSSQSAR